MTQFVIFHINYTSDINSLVATIGQHFFSHESSAARARELLKPSTDSASLLVDIKKNVFLFSVGVFWR